MWLLQFHAASFCDASAREANGIASQIQNRIDIDYVAFNLVVDAEREPFGERSVELKIDRMDACKRTRESKSDRIESTK